MAKNFTDKKSSKGISFDFSLTDKQKRFFAAFLALLTLIIITIVGILIYQGTVEPQEKPVADNPNWDAITANLDQSLSNINPEDLFYQEVTFEDLDIYPSSWIERNFTATERANSLISGATADPDGDGLSNKLEFIYGSNPKIKDTLCNGETTKSECKGRNDKENVDAGISPLTGLPLDKEKRVFTINFQDKAIIEELKDSFDNASREGLDFPTLYQLSKTVDYSNEVLAIVVPVQPETRQNLIDYTNYRIKLVSDILGNSELQSLSRIYGLASPSELQNQKAALTQKYKEVSEYQVPDSAAQSHKLYVFIFKQLVDLVTLRLDAMTANSLDSAAYQEKAKQTSIAIVWAYRKLNEGNVVAR